MRSLRWEREFMWFDLTGYSPISEGKMARVDLVTQGTHGQYEAVRAQIVDADKGVLDSKTFKFADYLKVVLNGENPNSRYVGSMKVIEHCGWYWYINQPQDVRQLTDAVEAWIAIHEGYW